MRNMYKIRLFTVIFNCKFLWATLRFVCECECVTVRANDSVFVRLCAQVSCYCDFTYLAAQQYVNVYCYKN